MLSGCVRKGKNIKSTLEFFYSTLWNFYSKFPFSPPKSCWLTLRVPRGLCLSPCRHRGWSKTWVLRVGVGERPQHTGAPAKPNHLSSGHRHVFLGTECAPKEDSKLFHYALINPGLSALGKATLFIKMPLWITLKTKIVVAPWWSVVKGKNNLVYTAQSPKKLEALIHT